jgi:hypothetical protein
MPKDETKTSLLNHHAKKPPPPAYSAYFDDPTLYAQIDHCGYNKSSTATLLGSSGQSLNNGSLKTAVGGGLLMSEQQQFNQLISPLNASSAHCNQNNQMLSSNNINNTGTLPFTSTTPTYTSITTSGGVASPFQTSNYQTLPLTSSNKQFLRDLVTTTKTPLSFSEQESCV